MPAASLLRVLYIGDIMGQPGRMVVQRLLPTLKRETKAHLVIAQAENVSHGKGMSPGHMQLLQECGVDFFSGGNHSIERKATAALAADPNRPVLAPINQARVEPAWGAKVAHTSLGPVQVISLLGTVFPLLDAPTKNPLRAIDEVLKQTARQSFAARIVNFHGDWSSEKRVIGYYLDGRVSAVVGDHWHVPTADAMVLPRGTAHITDVGMCGTLHSSLGVGIETIVARWRDGTVNKNDISQQGPYQFNAVLITVDTKTGTARSIEPLQRLVD